MANKPTLLDPDVRALLWHISAQVLPGEYCDPDIAPNGIAEAAGAILDRLERKPMKVDCIEIRCHPEDEQRIRETYDAPIVVDEKQTPGTIGVIPLAYAKNITMTVGFVNPEDGAKAS